MKKILIVGAGISGAIIARELAEHGYKITIIDSRNHVGGNCHTKRCEKTGIMVHVYGPHIFHTDDSEVWNYVNKFERFISYQHKVKTIHRGEVYSLPINLHTINQFFKTTFSPDEAKAHLQKLSLQFEGNCSSFEDQALQFVGQDLYDAFLKNYTEKQWGIHPKELPASILKRLPVRFNYDDNYFSNVFQGIPENGYTKLVENVLEHDLIELKTLTPFNHEMTSGIDHIFWTGAIDEFFGYCFGSLEYRTLEFEKIEMNGDFQGCAVMNYADKEIPYTRITEHKHFTPWENHQPTICYKEFSRTFKQGDIPYYPIRLTKEQKILEKYLELVKHSKNVTFVGRLGTYRYLDMDVSVREALNISKLFCDYMKENKNIPPI